MTQPDSKSKVISGTNKALPRCDGPDGRSYPHHNPLIIPIFITIVGCFGTSIIRESLPSIPFLLPTGILLYPLTSSKVHWSIRGVLKTILAFFFLFSGVQNTFFYELKHSFIQHGQLNVITNDLHNSGFSPLENLNLPQFIVITETTSVCKMSSTNPNFNKKYQHPSNFVKNIDNFQLEDQCIDIEPFFEIPYFQITLGLTPEFSFTQHNTLPYVSPNNQDPVKPATAAQSIQTTLVNRARFLLANRSLIPISNFSNFIYDLYQNSTQHQFYIMFGLFLSMIGDICLIFGGIDIFFLFGLVAFLGGHVNYATSFYFLLRYRLNHVHALFPTFSQSFSVLTVLLAIGFLYLAVTIYQWIASKGKLAGPLSPAVMVYLAIISIMTCSAILLAIGLPLINPTTAINVNIGSTDSIRNGKYGGYEFKPAIHSAVAHVFDIIIRSPMYISTLICYNIGITQYNPTDIAGSDLNSFYNVPAESWQVFFSVIGAIMFLISDIFVARQKFVCDTPSNTVIGLPLYFVAQLLLANSIFF
jgi:uncharacterized membrane protein YhhN